MPNRARRLGNASLLVVPLLAWLSGCGGEEPDLPRKADRVTLLSGDNQEGPVGVELPEPLSFMAGDGQGPLAGVRVDFSLSDRSGFLSAETANSDGNGVVTVRWTVGGTVGTQTLTASVVGGTPASARAVTREGPPALLSPVSEPSQFVVVNGTVASPPAVRLTDAFGNPLAAEPITFVDPSGRSTVVGGTTISDPTGRAGITSWQIAREAGSYTLVASTQGGIATNFIAFATPALVESVAGDGQAANAGTAAPIVPRIRAIDDRGQPLPGVGLTFRIAAGGGRLLASGNAQTGADGIATSPGWVLGPVPGANELVAEIPGIPPVAFHATGVAAVPASATVTEGAGQTGLAGNFAAARPAVRIIDAQARPVAGAPVTFAVTAGNGLLAGAETVTDFTGVATLGSWRFGSGPQTIEATAGTLPPLFLQATAVPPPPSSYQITVRFIGPEPTPSQKAAFESAAATWASLILGDLTDIPFDDDLSFCGQQVINEVIDDLLIFAKIDRIDGPGAVLGQAGACYLRDHDLLSLVGIMQFDADDVAGLETSGRFRDVVLHEMGHVIGVGSLWGLKELLVGRFTGDPHFSGPSARMAFTAAAASPTGFQGNIVPVENTGGPGTRDAHWRESVVANELMTGFINPGANPLSAITVASLRDEGYLVNDAAADPFTFGAALRAAATPAASLHTISWSPFVRTIDRSGRVRRVVDLREGPFRR